MTNDYSRIIKNILRDIQVELGDEFNSNFRRHAFFSEPWQRRKSPMRQGAGILSGQHLSRSIRSEIRGSSIVFTSDLPYSAIHNDGGEIRVTQRMKRFFRAKFYEAQGGFERKKGGSRRPLSDGGFYNWTEKMNLSTEAEFWRLMALMKVGSTIKIPRRRFLGNAPEVEQAVRQIIEENITEYFNTDFDIIER